jgi:hypothetical protein
MFKKFRVCSGIDDLEGFIWLYANKKTNEKLGYDSILFHFDLCFFSHFNLF